MKNVLGAKLCFFARAFLLSQLQTGHTSNDQPFSTVQGMYSTQSMYNIVEKDYLMKAREHS